MTETLKRERAIANIDRLKSKQEEKKSRMDQRLERQLKIKELRDKHKVYSEVPDRDIMFLSLPSIDKKFEKATFEREKLKKILKI